MATFECKCDSKQPSDGEVKSHNREDFMKRWFAIALSVGFATALSRMPWIENQLIFMTDRAIDCQQANQVMRLSAAGIATILSWEGYLLSIKTKPLIDAPRFYIDVFLVILYLILLLTSSSPHLWIAIHCFTFFIYIFWDFLSVKVHPSAYVLDEKDFYQSRYKIYLGAITGSKSIYHGLIVTLTWPFYLLTLVVTYYFLFNRLERSLPCVTFLYLALVLYGLYGYRSAKGDRDSGVVLRIQKVLVSSLGAIVLALLLKCTIQSV